MELCSPRARLWFISSFGWLFVLLGVVTLLFVPSVINKQVLERDFLGETEENGTFVPNNMTKSWANPSYDMQLEIWMFDVQNSRNILKGEKPIVREIGPFVFREKQGKDYEFKENGTRVVYKNNKLYYFNRTLSCPECDLIRKVTIPSVVFQKLVDFANMSAFYRLVINGLLVAFKEEAAFIHVTVGEALFEGYQEPILKPLCESAATAFLCKLFHVGRIGFFYGQNNTNDGSYEVDTGYLDPMHIGKLHSWNDKTHFDNVWDEESAGDMNGGDGQLFQPLMYKGLTLDIVAPQICRTIHMDYLESVSFRNVPAYRFSIPLELYDTTLDVNKKFCNKNNTPVYFEAEVQPVGCVPPGFMDVSRCMPANPRIYLSQGHFLGAPKEVLQSIAGMSKPSMRNDRTFVDMEPTSGVPIRAKRVMQINLGMAKTDLANMSQFRPVIMPVLWMNETAIFDDDTASQLRDQLIFAKHVAFMTGVGLVSAGTLLWVIVGAVILVYAVSKRSEDTQPILNYIEEQEGEEDT